MPRGAELESQGPWWGQTHGPICAHAGVPLVCSSESCRGLEDVTVFTAQSLGNGRAPRTEKCVCTCVCEYRLCVCVYVWFFESQSLCVCGCVCVCVPVSVWMCVHAHECESVCECMCEGVGAGVAGVCVLGAGCTGPLVGEGPALQAAGFL